MPHGQPHNATQPPASAPAAPARRWHLRLIVTAPTLILLFVIIFGLVSYQTFSLHWRQLDELGATQIASELLETHLWTMLVLSAIAVLMGVSLAITIRRPLSALMEVSDKVARGQFDQRAPEHGGAAEFDALSRSFNAMMDGLNRSVEQRHRELLEGLPMGILTTDLDGRVSTVSPQAVDILGLPAERIEGRRLEGLSPLVATGPRALVTDLQRMIGGDQSLSNHEVALAGDEAVLVQGAPLRGNERRALGWVFSFRPARQVRELSDHLRRTDQLAALGTFSLGLAHQLRNPMGAIKGLAQLLKVESGLSPRSREYVERMVGEIDRVDRFVRQLLELSEQPGTPPKPLDPVDVVRQALALVQRQVPEGKVATVRIEKHFSQLPELSLEGDRLREAFYHLLINAYEWTPEGGTVRLKTRVCQTGAGMDAYEIEIANTGPRIPDHLFDRVFDPFFTTRDHGIGLGLTIARQIVIQNGGWLSVENTADGVRAVVAFDAARDAEAALEQTNPAIARVQPVVAEGGSA